MKRLNRLFRCSIFGLCLLLASGCSTIVTSSSQKVGMVASYSAGNIQAAVQLVDGKLGSIGIGGDELAWRLEKGNLKFMCGDYRGCLDEFRRCEELIVSYDERALVSMRDVGGEAASIMTNLNALPYRGWCRDRVALGIYKSLAYLGEGREDAFRAQVKRLREEHARIQDEYKKFFEKEEEQLSKARQQNVRIAAQASSANYMQDGRNASYVQALAQVTEMAHHGYGGFLNPVSLFLAGMSSVRDGNWDNARIEFDHLRKALPHSGHVAQYYVTALSRSGREIPPELSGVPPFQFPLEDQCVYVLFAHDLMAPLREIKLYFPIMVAWQIYQYRPRFYTGLTVEADGYAYVTEPLADMDGISAQEYSERMPGMLSRTLLSVLVKEAGYQAAMHNLRKRSTPGIASLANIGMQSYRALVNTADTRSWETLPAEFQLTQLPMPKDRRLKVSAKGSVAASVELQLPPDCGSAIVYVNAPSAQSFACHVFPMK